MVAVHGLLIKLSLLSGEPLRYTATMLTITVLPLEGPHSRQYRVSLTNTLDSTIVKGQIPWTQVLHPGRFGLDDTHMPADIWYAPPLELRDLAPAATVEFLVEGYDVAEAYDGPRQDAVICPLMLRIDGETTSIPQRIAITLIWPGKRCELAGAPDLKPRPSILRRILRNLVAAATDSLRR